MRLFMLYERSVEDVIDRLPQPGARDAYFKQTIHQTLIEHLPYIERYGDDMPAIRGAKCGAGTSWRMSNEGDKT